LKSNVVDHALWIAEDAYNRYIQPWQVRAVSKLKMAINAYSGN
jgi:hypothetical protein